MTNNLEEMFLSAVKSSFEKIDVKVERIIKETVESAVSGWDIRKEIEKKIKQSIGIENLDFGNYGRFVQNLFAQAVKDFKIEQLESDLKKIADNILGAPAKAEYDLWEDIIYPIMVEMQDSASRDFEEIDSDELEGFYFSGEAFYESSDFDSDYKHIYINRDKYTGSKYCYEVQLDICKKDEGTWELYGAKYGLFSVKGDEISIKSPYKEREKALADLALKGCKLINVEQALQNLKKGEY